MTTVDDHFEHRGLKPNDQLNVTGVLEECYPLNVREQGSGKVLILDVSDKYNYRTRINMGFSGFYTTTEKMVKEALVSATGMKISAEGLFSCCIGKNNLFRVRRIETYQAVILAMKPARRAHDYQENLVIIYK